MQFARFQVTFTQLSIIQKVYKYYLLSFRDHHTFKGSLKKSLRQNIVRQLQTSDPEICSHLVGKNKPKPLPISVRPFLKNPQDFKFQMAVMEEEDSDLSDTDSATSSSDDEASEVED